MYDYKSLIDIAEVEYADIVDFTEYVGRKLRINLRNTTYIRPRDSTYEMQLIFGHIQLKNKLPQVTKYLRYSISWYILVVPNVQLSCNPLCFIDLPFDIRS